MKVLVTGANGFVGAHLCRRLVERGADVRALVRGGSDHSGLKGQSVDIVHGDILDLPSLERATQDCEQVYHLAANVKFFTRNPAACVPQIHREHAMCSPRPGRQAFER